MRTESAANKPTGTTPVSRPTDTAANKLTPPVTTHAQPGVTFTQSHMTQAASLGPKPPDLTYFGTHSTLNQTGVQQQHVVPPHVNTVAPPPGFQPLPYTSTPLPNQSSANFGYQQRPLTPFGPSWHQQHSIYPNMHQQHSIYPSMPPHLPKIPTFSGDDPVPKGEVAYLVWRYEVQCLIRAQELSQNHILQVIRTSLRGRARSIICTLGESATLEIVLAKLDSLYSNASTKEDLLTEFFNSCQSNNESVTAYACRLETLLQMIIDKGDLPYMAKNDLLRHKFWTGLLSDALKLQTRHKYDYLTDYNDLLREIRQVEKEINSPSSSSNASKQKKAAQHQPVTVDSEASQQVQTLFKKLENLQEQVNSWESKIERTMTSKFDLLMSKLDQPNPIYSIISCRYSR